jgi:hypothetical protein
VECSSNKMGETEPLKFPKAMHRCCVVCMRLLPSCKGWLRNCDRELFYRSQIFKAEHISTPTAQETGYPMQRRCCCCFTTAVGVTACNWREGVRAQCLTHMMLRKQALSKPLSVGVTLATSQLQSTA